MKKRLDKLEMMEGLFANYSTTLGRILWSLNSTVKM